MREESINLTTLEKARAKKPILTFNEQTSLIPPFIGVKEFDLTLEDVKPYIDWNFFFTAWDMKGKYPEILSHPQKGEAARDLFEGGKKMLEEVIQNKTLNIKAIAGFWPAYSEGDDLIIQDEDEKDSVLFDNKEMQANTIIAYQTLWHHKLKNFRTM